MRAIVCGVCLLCFFSTAAFAAELINLDKKRYSFKVQDGGIISSFKISANASMSGLCTPGNACKITLKGRSVGFNSNSRLQIKGGKVSLQ